MKTNDPGRNNNNLIGAMLQLSNEIFRRTMMWQSALSSIFPVGGENGNAPAKLYLRWNDPAVVGPGGIVTKGG